MTDTLPTTYYLLMSIPGFDAAQARYDSMLPEDPPIFRCPVSGDMNEDCEECDECPEPEDDRDYEPDDLDDYRYGEGRYAEDDTDYSYE